MRFAPHGSPSRVGSSSLTPYRTSDTEDVARQRPGPRAPRHRPRRAAPLSVTTYIDDAGQEQ